MVKVQIDYVDFDTYVSVLNVSFTNFKHGRTTILKECWLVDDCFVILLESGDQICVDKGQARFWTALHAIDWLKDEQSLPLDDQVENSKARKSLWTKKK